ncbi:MAG: hypothetical protein RMJ67_01275 [Elusimicrobiota bacterium]|nr:hypothetical protein [Endomicrobiia bacterium]MDW8165135.1 hypothetical protein [Elusimicrobiota bacterium]
MFFTSGVIKAVKSVVYTKKPLSLLLVAPQGSGKSKILRSLKGSVILVDDITATGLKDAIMDEEKRFIVISDFNQIASRGKTTSPISMFLPVLQEGYIGEIKYQTQVKLEKPIRKGLITGMTTEMFEDYLEDFIATGFITRFIVINFSYLKEEFDFIKEKILFTNYKEEELEIYVPSENEIQEKELNKDILDEETLKILERFTGFLKNNIRLIMNFKEFIEGVSRVNTQNKKEISDYDIREAIAILYTYSRYQNPGNNLMYQIMRKKLGIDHEDYEKFYSDYTIDEYFKILDYDT